MQKIFGEAQTGVGSSVEVPYWLHLWVLPSNRVHLPTYYCCGSLSLNDEHPHCQALLESADQGTMNQAPGHCSLGVNPINEM